MLKFGKHEFPHFSRVQFIKTPAEGIAKSRRRDGLLVINLHWWPKLKEEHKMFVLCHEEGHIAHNTRDEMLADKYASEKYFAAGYSLSESVKAITQLLKTRNPVHTARAWVQFQRALKYDWEVNKNQKAYRTRYDNINDAKFKLLNNEF